MGVALWLPQSASAQNRPNPPWQPRTSPASHTAHSTAATQRVKRQKLRNDLRDNAVHERQRRRSTATARKPYADNSALLRQMGDADHAQSSQNHRHRDELVRRYRDQSGDATAPAHAGSVDR